MIRILACAISSASHIVFWFIIQFLEILNGYFRNIVYDSTCKAKTGNASQKTGWWRFPEQTPPFQNRFFILPLYVEKPFTVTLKPLRQSGSLWRAFPGCMHFHVIAEDVPCVLSTQTNTRVRLFRVFTLIDVGECIVFVIYEAYMMLSVKYPADWRSTKDSTRYAYAIGSALRIYEIFFAPCIWSLTSL